MQSQVSSQTMDQIRQKNIAENKKNNKTLKLQLKEISSQIEQVLNLQESKKMSQISTMPQLKLIFNHILILPQQLIVIKKTTKR